MEPSISRILSFDSLQEYLGTVRFLLTDLVVGSGIAGCVWHITEVIP